MSISPHFAHREKDMSRLSLLRVLAATIQHGVTAAPRRRPEKRRSSRYHLPRLESLEKRMVLSFTVLNLADAGAGSLRDAISSANLTPGADAIDFSPGLRGTITLKSGELQVTDDVTINGPGAKQLSISGNNSSRVFSVLDLDTADTATPDVVIEGLTITKGLGKDFGGGILSENSNLTLNEVVLSRNRVEQDLTNPNSNGGRGGGVASRFGTLNIFNSTITDNQARGNRAFGGGVFGFQNPIIVTDSLIQRNLSRAYDNGDNGIAGEGGLLSNGGDLTISDSTIKNNVAQGGDDTPVGSALGGGAGVLGDVVLVVTDSTFSGNKAIGGNGAGGAPPGTNGEGSGGAMRILGATATITDTSFTRNQAIGGNDVAAVGTGDYQAGNGVGAQSTLVLARWTSALAASNATKLAAATTIRVLMMAADNLDGSVPASGGPFTAPLPTQPSRSRIRASATIVPRAEMEIRKVD